MPRNFEELDFRPTPIGDVSLRRRLEPRIGRSVYEIKLGDEFLISSLITTSEIALATLALAAHSGQNLAVAVGGLGLGYTARAVLDDASVRSLVVIDYLEAVIGWHRSGLLPLGEGLVSDPRCTLRHADFFSRAASPEGLDPEAPGKRYDVILVDIDHAPTALLDQRSTSFYTARGFTALARHLEPQGIFALWSDAPPDAVITDRLRMAFAKAWAEPIAIDIPERATPFTQTVYLARKAAA